MYHAFDHDAAPGALCDASHPSPPLYHPTRSSEAWQNSKVFMKDYRKLIK